MIKRRENSRSQDQSGANPLIRTFAFHLKAIFTKVPRIAADCKLIVLLSHCILFLFIYLSFFIFIFILFYFIYLFFFFFECLKGN